MLSSDSKHSSTIFVHYRSKNDQEGLRKQYRSLFANPFLPAACVVHLLALYFLSTSRFKAEEKEASDTHTGGRRARSHKAKNTASDESSSDEESDHEDDDAAGSTSSPKLFPGDDVYSRVQKILRSFMMTPVGSALLAKYGMTLD